MTEIIQFAKWYDTSKEKDDAVNFDNSIYI